MIQRLRRKFIATNMLLVSIVLLIVFSVQIFSTVRQALGELYTAQEQTLSWISGSLRPSFVFDRPRPEGSDWADERQDGAERGMRREQDFPTIPVFAVEVDEAGKVCTLQTGPWVEVTEETAQTMADEVLVRDSERGYLSEDDLSYMMRAEEGRRFIVFADIGSVKSSVQRQVLFYLGICAAALLAFYLISRFLANLSVQPVEKAWEQQRQFVADASHELKTPITVILATTGILQSHPEDTVAEQSRWINSIQDEAQQMRGLVDDLLYLAKSDAAKLPFQPAPIRMSDLVLGALLPFESVAFEKGVTLNEDIAPDLTYQGDEAQLRRLVGILTDNAIKYAGEQGEVTVRLEESQNRLRLSVRNTGPAIAPEHLPHLFERFYRTDAARNRDQGGSGLGLAIAKDIAETHGGKIGVTSSPEEGTTFTVIFPKK